MKIENPCLSWFNNLQPIALRQTDACRLPARRRAGDPRPLKKKKTWYCAWQVFCTLPTLKAHLSLGIVIVHCCAQSLLYMSNISRCRRPISRLTVESATAGDGPISSAAAARRPSLKLVQEPFFLRKDPRLSNETRFPCQV